MSLERGIEIKPLSQLEEVQERKLRHLARWAYERTGLYRREWDGVGLKPKDIRKMEDLKKVPLGSLGRSLFKAQRVIKAFS
jgi:phenylacetate-CoA ligase